MPLNLVINIPDKSIEGNILYIELSTATVAEGQNINIIGYVNNMSAGIILPASFSGTVHSNDIQKN
jgi:ribosomal protein S4E